MKYIIEYESKIMELSAVLGVNCKSHNRIIEIVGWCRREFQTLPNQYIGDAEVIEIMIKHAKLGNTLNFCIMEVYHQVKCFIQHR